MERSSLSLAVVSDAPPREWNGLVAPESLIGAFAPPEPDSPQGEYDSAGSPRVQLSFDSSLNRNVELLAPAGGPDAAFAAFHYGADAVYLGLKKFSARAEAENFSLEELDEIVAYAHAIEPRRRVFVTINTVIRNDELPELIENLDALQEIGVDAVIIQDLGVYRLVREHFPRLELHASTQLAVHNRAGAEAMRALGFARVVLARELTFEEVQDITASSGVETEVFIHGALCYSYSGLCLFSAQTLGRSGNRGKCAYSCRDSFEVAGAPDTLRDGQSTRRDPSVGFPFSMKDLALPDHMPALRAAGVSCFKIEGRKKSPLYVATTTDYYRRLIDGTLPNEERSHHEEELQTVFSRPWTHLFVESHKDKEVADRDTVGHRGALVGVVDRVVSHRNERRLRFRTARTLERHDGIQVDLPLLGKPFGFPVDQLWQAHRANLESVISAAAGSIVEVTLPPDAPDLPKGAPVYCSSSQEVKRKYRHNRPKPGLYRVKHTMNVELQVASDKATVIGRVAETDVVGSAETIGTFSAANSLQDEVIRNAFSKLGDTGFTLGSCTIANTENRFVPVSRLNQLRRDLVQKLEQEIEHKRRLRIASILEPDSVVCPKPRPHPGFRWNIKIDRLSYIDAFEHDDWSNVDEAVIDITRDHATTLLPDLQRLAAVIGRDRIRLALPALTRKWEEPGLAYKIDRLLADGWTRWEAANVSAWTYLRSSVSGGTTLDLASDWSLYATNRWAALQLLAMGASRFCLSPEDGLENISTLLAEFGPKAVLIVFQDTPLFLAESCAYANLIGGCPGKANCRFESMTMTSSHGEKVLALDYHCRTIVLNEGPFCLSPRLPDLARAGAESLRCDFVYRPYDPMTVRDIWRRVRSGKVIAKGHAANFDRGIL
jgi:putative protease